MNGKLQAQASRPRRTFGPALGWRLARWVALFFLAAPLARAETKHWNWKLGVCGSLPGGLLEPQTSSPDERCAIVPGTTVTVRSSTLCSADPARRLGVISLTPAPPPPPPTTYDFSYSYGDPTLAAAKQYIVSTSNAQTWEEGAGTTRP